MAEEVAQVVARVGRVGEGVEDEGAPGVVGGWGQRAVEGAAAGVELVFCDVGIWCLRWGWGGCSGGVRVYFGSVEVERLSICL